MRAVALVLSVALAGCSVAVTGAETSGRTATAAATQAHARLGSHASATGSFGSPPPAGASGGQVSLSRGAAGVLVLGLVIADLVQALVPGTRAQGAALDPNRPIAQTCSCYGYVPATELTTAAPSE